MLDEFLFRGHLDDEEEICAIVHKHWVLGVMTLFWPTTSFAAAWAVLYYVPFRMMFYIISLWGVVSLVWWLRNFFDYYLDAWIITDQGVLDLEWHGWFHRQVTRMLYSDIQGVSYEVQGLMGTLMDFGFVSIEKISTDALVEMEAVRHPKAVTRMILKNMEKYLHSKNLKDARHVQELLAEVIANRVRLDDVESELEEEEAEELVENENNVE